MAASLVKNETKNTIIICEDEPDLLQVYCMALRRRYNVVATNNGKECLRKYSEMQQAGKRADVLIVDYRLGDMHGDEVSQKMDNAGMRRILITAAEFEPAVLEGMKGWASAILKKPVSLRSLIETVENVIAE